ncbi:exonuclease [Trichuris suis]|nr:exonuclease [Trichuris suis]
MRNIPGMFKYLFLPFTDDCLRMSEVLALDCEFVGGGFDGSKDILARVSLVDGSLRCVYDKFVKTEETIVDYRTAVSGVRPENVANGESLPVVRREVAALISRRVLVGHGVRKDLDVIGLTHSRRLIRDTSTFPLFHKMLRTRLPKLRVLSATLLGEEIQNGEHDSVEDATAAMKLYLAYRKVWQKSRRRRT